MDLKAQDKMAKKKGIFSKLKEAFAPKRQGKSNKTHKILADWKTLYEDLQSHPLTQAKVISEQLLSATNETIKKFESRLAEFDERISRLEKRRIKIIRNAQEIPFEILNNISKLEPKKKARGRTPAQIVKQVIADPHMSDHEKEIIRKIQEQGDVDAQTLAKQFNISRSNASLKLNKLHDWGYLSKRAINKTVFYRIRDDKDQNQTF